MSHNSFGNLLKFTTWGESHGEAIGCVVDGFPSGITIDTKFIQTKLNLRKPGQSKFTTQRKEKDEVKILSGVFEGKSTGAPISMIIHNTDQRSKDYSDIKDEFIDQSDIDDQYNKSGISKELIFDKVSTLLK